MSTVLTKVPVDAALALPTPTIDKPLVAVRSPRDIYATALATLTSARSKLAVLADSKGPTARGRGFGTFVNAWKLPFSINTIGGLTTGFLGVMASASAAVPVEVALGSIALLAGGAATGLVQMTNGQRYAREWTRARGQQILSGDIEPITAELAKLTVAERTALRDGLSKLYATYEKSLSAKAIAELRDRSGDIANQSKGVETRAARLATWLDGTRLSDYPDLYELRSIVADAPVGERAVIADLAESTLFVDEIAVRKFYHRDELYGILREARKQTA